MKAIFTYIGSYLSSEGQDTIRDYSIKKNLKIRLKEAKVELTEINKLIKEDKE